MNEDSFMFGIVIATIIILMFAIPIAILSALLTWIFSIPLRIAGMISCVIAIIVWFILEFED